MEVSRIPAQDFMTRCERSAGSWLEAVQRLTNDVHGLSQQQVVHVVGLPLSPLLQVACQRQCPLHDVGKRQPTMSRYIRA